MKKKLVSLLMTTVFALSASVALVACGGDDGAGGTDNTFRSEKIETEAEWKAAFDYADVHNVTVDYTMKVGENREKSCVRYVDGCKERDVGKEVDKEENYSVEYDTYWSSDKTLKMEYSYTYDAQLKKYMVREFDRSGFVADDEEWAYDADHYIDELNDWARITKRYADYHYDEKLGAYVAEYKGQELDDDWDLINFKVVVKFKDGKVLEGSINGTEKTEGKIEIKVSVSNVGTTTVTLPTNIQNSAE